VARPGLSFLLGRGIAIAIMTSQTTASGESSPSSAQTTVLVGIDEAGYGPLLGPLVVSATAFEVPVRFMKDLGEPGDGPDLWKILGKAVSRKLGRRDCRLVVADSKKIYSAVKEIHGIGLLERAALTFLGQLPSGAHATFLTLLRTLCPAVCDEMGHYPWYANYDTDLPGDAAHDDVCTQRRALATALSHQGIRFLGAWSEVLPEGHYNRLVNNTHNKAVVLFGLNMRLIQRIATEVGPRPMRIWIDRHGGRIGYRQPLMTAFEDAHLDILEETPERSSYRLTRRPAPWLIRFVKGGEDVQLPVALASIYSKYLRELFMKAFNRYWASHIEALRPTAGYYGDGQRFLEDIRDEIVRLRINREILVRNS
jgi:ribonuclease HII